MSSQVTGQEGAQEIAARPNDLKHPPDARHDEPGQVFLQAWGGANTIARELKSIHDQYQGTPQWDAIYDKIVNKAVITSIGQQDSTFDDYIKPNWPDIQNREVATRVWEYGSRDVVLPEDAFYHSAEWTKTNVSDVGPIGASYRV